ncbi:hypothetical protein MUG09_03565 [Sphaerochaeta associata]|uniref:Uncharacterized protein n=1 Tax=Sphaerochaeta associata TaxID=1129264 RepID=A0ABY4DEC0_9SPIR|nr:hypothetical protein [Sphaerochaeta associata]UOM51853.1 hypothetical protein MUG09_03565 [Sphaerochaeta associata]
MAHDAGGLLSCKEGDKTGEGEIQEVVPCQDEQVLVDFLLFYVNVKEFFPLQLH